ncbi:MAG: hypothetical protein U0165_12120 [Polyangiaceae bacterium]
MFFAPRQGGMVAPLVSTGPHLGVLGASKMGEKPEAYDALPESRAQPISRAIQTQVASSSDALREALGALSGRDGRRRALRLSPARQEANEQAPLAATGTGHRRLRSGLDR